MIHILDTHALARHIEDPQRLGTAGRALYDDPGALYAIPTIVLAEARHMIIRNKVGFAWVDVIRTLETDTRLVSIPLTLEVLHLLPDGLEMHDGIICATALLVRDSLGEDVAVITRDKEIRESGLVETVW